MQGLAHNAVDPNTVKSTHDEHESSGRKYAYSLLLKYFEELRARFEPDGLTYALVLRVHTLAYEVLSRSANPNGWLTVGLRQPWGL